MLKKKELTIIERGIIIGLHKAGESERAISKKTGYSKTAIHHIITKFNETGLLINVPRRGRPKKLTERDKWHLKLIINKERREPAQKIQETFVNSTGNEVSKNTI